MIPYGHQSLNNEDFSEVLKILKSDWLTQGPKAVEFEKALAKYCNAKYSVVTSSGTAALHLAYLAAELKKGDEIITTPNTFVATTNMLLAIGAKPVFCDIRLDTYNIDESKIEKLITSKTKAIVPVHFAGHPCEMDKILKLAKKHKLLVIEDASHALGAKYKNKRVGSLSDMSIFSFHPVKPITTGEGGAILTNNKNFYKKLLLLRNHGMQKDKNGFNITTELGYNYRMTDMQATLGVSQLKKLSSFIKKRNQITKWYERELKNVKEINIPKQTGNITHGWHIYVIRTKNSNARMKLANHLKKKGVGVNFHYPAVYSHPYYQKNGYKKIKLTNEEEYQNSCITLPIYPQLTKKQIKYIGMQVRKFFMKNSLKNRVKISNIIFDWGGVLSRSGNIPRHPIFAGKTIRNSDSSAKELVNVADLFSRGKMASSKYWQKYAELSNITDITPIELKKRYLMFTPDQAMLNLLKSLAVRYPVTLLSNLNVDMKAAIIKRLKIRKYFKHMIFSNDIGLLKSEPIMYKIALQKLNVKASETLLIDDTEENIDIAKKLGMKTILFTSEKKCRAKLKHLKLL